MQILINDQSVKSHITSRKMVSADLIKQNQKTVIVRLPDGNHTKRKIKRDVEAIR